MAKRSNWLFCLYLLALVMGYFAVDLSNHLLGAIAIGVAFVVGIELGAEV